MFDRRGSSISLNKPYKDVLCKCLFCLACHASIKRYSYSAKETLSGPIYDVKSLKGLTVTGDGLVTLDLEVFQSSTDIDYVSFSVTQTDHVMVDFFKDAYVPIQQVIVP